MHKKNRLNPHGNRRFFSFGNCVLLYAGAGLDLGPGSALALGLGGGKGGDADGQGDEGGYGDDHGLFHGDTPFVPVGLMKHVWYIPRSVPVVKIFITR